MLAYCVPLFLCVGFGQIFGPVSALSQHQETTGHNVLTSLEYCNIKVLERETRYSHRKVLEVIIIRLKGAELNRNDGTELPNLYLPLLREGAGKGGLLISTSRGDR